MVNIGILNKITDPAIEKKAVNAYANIDCVCATNEAELSDDISNYDAVIVSYKFKISKKTIDRLTNCKAIVCACVGFDNVDYLYAAEKGIRVFNVPDYGTNDVADHAFALLLSYARQICMYNNNLKTDLVKNWNPKTVLEFHRLTGKKVGIIGLGRIGTAFAIRAKSFGMQVLFFDPYKQDGYEKTLQFERVDSIEQIFNCCDIISIHAPLTSETIKMISWDIIKNSKHKPIIINTARGKIVDNESICRAIREDIIEAFLADVLEFEPPAIDDVFYNYAKDPILSNRILLTPHAASYAEESQYEMRYKSAECALKAVLNNKYLRNCINFRGNIYE